VAGAFLVSVMVGRPLARRFAGDLCSLPRGLFHDPDLHRFFQRVSLMWAAVVLVNAGLAFWLLVTQTTTVYLVTQTMLSITLARCGRGGFDALVLSIGHEDERAVRRVTSAGGPTCRGRPGNRR